MSSIKVFSVGCGNKVTISTTKSSAYVNMEGRVIGIKHSETHRKVFNKRLPWWKRFWKRLFGVKTPDYTAGNYD